MTLRGRSVHDPRVRIRVGIDVTPGWKGGTPVAMETIDVSANGAALQSSINLPLKTQVSVRIHVPAFPGQRPCDLSCEAVVVNIEEIGRTRREWRAGIYFLCMNQSDQLLLKRFIYTALTASSEAENAGVAGG